MQIDVFKINCPYEIGDKVIDYENNKELIVTDIALIHYTKKNKTEFMIEFDGEGKYFAINSQNNRQN